MVDPKQNLIDKNLVVKEGVIGLVINAKESAKFDEEWNEICNQKHWPRQVHDFLVKSAFTTTSYNERKKHKKHYYLKQFNLFISCNLTQYEVVDDDGTEQEQYRQKKQQEAIYIIVCMYV